jgi:hypothetical protein
VPQGGRIEARIAAHAAHHHYLSRVQTKPDVEVDAVGTAQLGIAGDGPGQVPGGVAGPTRVVFLRHRGAEEGHDPVTGELVDRAPEAPHAFGEDLGEAADDPGPRLRVEALLEIHGALDVGEQDRELLALALRLGGGGPLPATNRGRGECRGQWGAALATEPLPLVVGGSARDADTDGQRGATLRAELATLPVLVPAAGTGGVHRIFPSLASSRDETNAVGRMLMCPMAIPYARRATRPTG